jgi:hypothetical protein
MGSVSTSVTMFRPDRAALTEGGVTRVGWRPEHPTCSAARAARGADGLPGELVEKMGSDVQAKVERRRPRRHHELGPRLVCTGTALWPDPERGPYARMYDPALKRSAYVHLIVWRRCFGPIPKGLDVDHRCDVALCARPDHLQVLTKADNVKRRGPTRGPKKRASDRSQTEPAFAIAPFAGIERPTVAQKTVSLDELRPMLSRFEVLADKRRGRCWSPTRYAAGASSRGNAGVLEVSALVFDCDWGAPNPERLARVYWLGHTTWSHTPTAPRRRVVIGLATLVPAVRWRYVWQRARAALCPEADPACKDPSRAYWLPSHSGGVTAKATCHDGPLLDASTLPRPPGPERPELQRTPSARTLRRTTDSDRRRGEAYMDSVIASLEAAAPGGQNAALNRAAWTLGRWVAAGALAQNEVEDELYAAAECNHLVADDANARRGRPSGAVSAQAYSSRSTWTTTADDGETDQSSRA